MGVIAKVATGTSPEVAAGGDSGKMTGAFDPGAAGPWMWPALAFVPRPAKRAVIAMVVSAVLSTTTP